MKAAPRRKERERALVETIDKPAAQLKAETAAHQRTEADKFLLSSIVESSEDSIVSITFDAVITSWNKAAENLYGYPTAEVLGHPLIKLTLPEDLQEMPARIDNVKQHQRVESGHTQVHCGRIYDGPHPSCAAHGLTQEGVDEDPHRANYLNHPP